MNKLERVADVLGLKDEFKDLIVPYIDPKIIPFQLKEMERVPGNLLPEYKIKYQSSKFFRDVMIKEPPKIEKFDKLNVNVLPDDLVPSKLRTENFVKPIVQAVISEKQEVDEKPLPSESKDSKKPPNSATPLKRKASATTKAKKKRK
eukprot:NODE_4_length_77007_cov_1.156642.p65 type:complete len:147 gc:universal NODE_4_length_77007_cov_1.156642:22522-22962(+)